jgi:hypothetical protein
MARPAYRSGNTEQRSCAMVRILPSERGNGADPMVTMVDAPAIERKGLV